MSRGVPSPLVIWVVARLRAPNENRDEIRQESTPPTKKRIQTFDVFLLILSVETFHSQDYMRNIRVYGCLLQAAMFLGSYLFVPET